MTAIPALLPAASQPITSAYLTPAQFRAFPTWMDTDNLIENAVASAQDDALADALLAASSEADSMCEGMRLSAHYVQGENRTTAVTGGRILLKPRRIPVCAAVSLTYGWDPDCQTALSLGPGVLRDEGDQRLFSFRPGGGSGAVFTGPALQFGGGPVGNGRVYVTWSYVAGFVSSLLNAECADGADSVTVDDPTGVMPGGVLRLYDLGEDGAGATEALTVAPGYVPQVPTIPPTPTVIPLAAPAKFAHAAGTGITGFPRNLLQAVIALTVVLLVRRDVADEEPAGEYGPSARKVFDDRSGAAGGLVNFAESVIDRYRPVWP